MSEIKTLNGYELRDEKTRGDLLFYESDEVREPIDVITSPVTIENDGGWAEIEINFYPTLDMFTPNAELHISINGTEYILPVGDSDGFGDWDGDEYPYFVEIYNYEGTTYFAINNYEDVASYTVSYARIVFASPDIILNSKYKDVINYNYILQSMAIGINKASGACSFAEGQHTTSSSDCSHSEGWRTVASSQSSHAEGFKTVASNYASHAEGQYTTSSGYCSHAEGVRTTAKGYASHSGGAGTTASGDYQTVFGVANVEDTTSLLIIGNGTMATKSNAHKLDSKGNAWYAGNVEAHGGKLKLGNTEITEAQLQALLALLS